MIIEKKREEKRKEREKQEDEEQVKEQKEKDAKSAYYKWLVTRLAYLLLVLSTSVVHIGSGKCLIPVHNVV